MRRWYDLALRLTIHSTNRKHKMAAVIVRGGNVITWGVNDQARYSHAEHRAIRYGVDYNKSTVYVARENNSMSRPCERCMQELKKVGIYRIVYADWGGQLRSEAI